MALLRVFMGFVAIIMWLGFTISGIIIIRLLEKMNSIRHIKTYIL